MIKKTLFFTQPAYLHISNRQLIIDLKNQGTTHQVPVEDIGFVILENQQITVTQSVIASLIDNNACILCCDEKHMPSGLLMPLAQNNTFTEKVRYQLEASEPLKKNLWKQTVVSKIRNQAALLTSIGIDSTPMHRWASEVTSGDKGNVEAKAASYYWEKYFEYLKTKANRHRNGPPPNNLLNYGYAILRAVVARSLSASGCLLMVGIYHRNKYNPFCLADDVMEPYRPFVDQVVLNIVSQLREIPEQLTTALKKELLVIPTLDTLIDGQKSPLMIATQRTSASLVACFGGESRKMLYPEML
ncbi:CRISPR-associated endonuclease Cas1 [Thermaurantimonas aggregans]|uniref:CRISPR-associated endonuclease Cas1 n=1 Tax=Thermaurantimonas aggregans TaxID=2173829 RepID=A0A401XMD2_9FLAO|nr:type II CRISPR-associated endonuclease Cas1 [Thermaurantimonas aggregans]GCD78179.1 CRISPR-associated endonuclease Cas1 [Thermaurantimonas aggregans]